ncbi:MAG: AzlD domain-containing protein [Clostridia bacterium]|nr:AzlD domain-containing protein [Clostridia bacterium]
MIESILVMAVVTYLVRMLPMALFKKKIENNFIRSFLYYVPFAVLGAMTFPAIFTSTSSLYSAIAGTLAAMVLSLKEKSLLTVALSACLTVFAVDWILKLLA